MVKGGFQSPFWSFFWLQFAPEKNQSHRDIPEAGAVAVDPHHESSHQFVSAAREKNGGVLNGKALTQSPVSLWGLLCSWNGRWKIFQLLIVAFFDTSRTHQRKSFRLQTLELLLLASFVFYVLASPHPKKPPNSLEYGFPMWNMYKKMRFCSDVFSCSSWSILNRTHLPTCVWLLLSLRGMFSEKMGQSEGKISG